MTTEEIGAKKGKKGTTENTRIVLSLPLLVFVVVVVVVVLCHLSLCHGRAKNKQPNNNPQVFYSFGFVGINVFWDNSYVLK